ncbi:MAG: hypothetical protein NVV83_09605 [Afipia sp.]|nr:hypothetical protein [Afipia sp.]
MINRRILLAQSLALTVLTGTKVRASTEPGLQLSAEFARMAQHMTDALANHRAASAQLAQVEPRLRMAMKGNVKVRWRWYCAQPEVRATNDTKAAAIKTVEDIFMTPADTNADRRLKRVAIALYESEFGDKFHLARKHFLAG